MKKKDFFYFFLIISIFLSCKPKKEDSSEKVMNFVQSITFTDAEDPILIPKLKDPSCDEKKGLKTLGKVKITIFNPEKEIYEKVEKDLSSVSGNPIKSSFITSVKLGREEVRTVSGCTNSETKNKNEFVCKKEKKQKTKEGDSVSLCATEYEEDDLENHILAGIYFVESTFLCAKSMGINLNSLILNMYPSIYFLMDGKKKFKTDNAFWRTNKDYGDESLNILPHTLSHLSKEAFNAKAFGITFTQQNDFGTQKYQYALTSDVLAHELSHHVVDHHIRSSQEIILARIEDQHYETHNNYDAPPEVRALNQIKNSLNAFHEMGADAFAEVCHKNNATDKVRFRGTEGEKTLSEDKLSNFLGEGSGVSTPHLVGAIMHNALKEYWGTLGVDVLNKKSNDDIEKAKNLLKEGFSNLGNINPPTSPKDYIAFGFFSLIKSTLKEKNGKYEVTKEGCRVLNSRLPALVKPMEQWITCAS